MNPKRRIAIVALFLTTALIGAGAIYIGSRLSSQPEITPDDAAAETQGFGVSFNYIDETNNEWRWSSYGHVTTCEVNSTFSNVEYGVYHCRGTGSAACTTTSADYEETLVFRGGNTLTCRQGPMSEVWTHPSVDCGRVQIDLGLPGGGGIFGGAVRGTSTPCGTTVTPPQDTSVPTVTPTRVENTATPTPTTIPFDIQVLAFCQDGSGPRYLVGGADLVIVDKDGNATSPQPPRTNDNGAYTTVKQNGGPYVGHVRISGNGSVALKNQTTGQVERTVDISALTKLAVTGNSTGLAPQCNLSGNNAPGQCTCGGQYETCNFNQAGANANNRFYFEFKFSNCLGTAEVTPTPTLTPVPGELVCGEVCSPGTSVCAAGTVCSNVEGTYRCALQTCIDNPGACADICSFEKLPQTALISDEADRIILAVILVLMGGLAIRFGMNEKLGDLFWSMGGKYVLSKVHPAYARELKVETKKKVQSKRKKERSKFEKNF